MDADLFTIVVWCALTPVAAYFAGWAVLQKRPSVLMSLLIGLPVFYLITDAIFIGGFHLDGVTSFPVFAGIAASLLWFVIWAISAIIGSVVRRRRAIQSGTP